MDIFSMLKYDEGLKTVIYKDTRGYYTIGIGHLVSTNPSLSVAISVLDASLGRSTNGAISTNEAQSLFTSDVAKAQSSLTTVGLGDLVTSLDPIRQAALINMSFQLGARGVAAFKNSMSLLRAQNWEQAAIELKNSAWYNQTTNRASRVIETFRTGTWAAYPQ